MHCRAYAKGLHYKEEEFHRGPNTKTLESLISINNKLQQPDAAAGVLVFAQKHHQGDFVSGAQLLGASFFLSSLLFFFPSLPFDPLFFIPFLQSFSSPLLSPSFLTDY